MVVAVFQGNGVNSAGLKAVAILEEKDRLVLRFQNKSYQTMGHGRVDEGEQVTVYGSLCCPDPARRWCWRRMSKISLGSRPCGRNERACPSDGWHPTAPWRTKSANRMSNIEPSHRPFQYSLSSLFVLTTVVAVFCSLGVATDWGFPIACCGSRLLLHRLRPTFVAEAPQGRVRLRDRGFSSQIPWPATCRLRAYVFQGLASGASAAVESCVRALLPKLEVMVRPKYRDCLFLSGPHVRGDNSLRPIIGPKRDFETGIVNIDAAIPFAKPVRPSRSKPLLLWAFRVIEPTEIRVANQLCNPFLRHANFQLWKVLRSYPS